MKKYIEFSIIVILTLFNINYVNAESCDANDIKRLRVLASNIDITYEYNDNVFDSSDNKINDAFDISFNNVTDNFYIYDTSTGYLYDDLEVKDEKIVLLGVRGKNHRFSIYSSTCDVLLKTYSIETFKTNIYASDALCKGHEKLDVCKEDFDTSDLTREEFVKIIEDYDKNGILEEDIVNKKNITGNKILDFLINNFIYTIVGIIVIVSVVLVLLVHRHKKRGVLE